jgi:hypothetical protein
MEISWDSEGVDIWNWITTKELGASLKIVDPAKAKMIEANYEKLMVQLCRCVLIKWRKWHQKHVRVCVQEGLLLGSAPKHVIGGC